MLNIDFFIYLSHEDITTGKPKYITLSRLHYHGGKSTGKSLFDFINVTLTKVSFKTKTFPCFANRQETNEGIRLGESLKTLLSQKCNFHSLSSNTKLIS